VNDELEDFVRDLQDRIDEDVLQTYGRAAYARWREPRFVGSMDAPDGRGRVTGTCGDTMEIFLRFRNGRVEAATFMTDGCGSSIICGSFAAELARGKTPEELIDVTGERLLDCIGGLPEAERHCAFLAAAALREALEDCMKQAHETRTF